jgi:hypothetical protein
MKQNVRISTISSTLNPVLIYKPSIKTPFQKRLNSHSNSISKPTQRRTLSYSSMKDSEKKKSIVKQRENSIDTQQEQKKSGLKGIIKTYSKHMRNNTTLFS